LSPTIRKSPCFHILKEGLFYSGTVLFSDISEEFGKVFQKTGWWHNMQNIITAQHRILTIYIKLKKKCSKVAFITFYKLFAKKHIKSKVQWTVFMFHL
jgi:hypothetical protein